MLQLALLDEADLGRMALEVLTQRRCSSLSLFIRGLLPINLLAGFGGHQEYLPVRGGRIPRSCITSILSCLHPGSSAALKVGSRNFFRSPCLIKRSQISGEAWENSPHNTRKNPKLSPEEAQRIADEAIAGGQVWDVQEKINARRRAELNARREEQGQGS
jgi:hypothetical protein